MRRYVPDKYIPGGISAEQQASIHAEGKQAFALGLPRSTNPYTATNTALAAIWWNGWDTGEESGDEQQDRKK